MGGSSRIGRRRKGMRDITEKKYLSSGEDRSLHGAFGSRDIVRFELYGDMTDAVMELHRDGEGDIYIALVQSGDGVFSREVSMSELCGEGGDGLFWYRYRLTFSDGGTMFMGGEAPLVLLPCSEAGDRQLLIYRDGYTTPKWLHGCVIYHIFVDRFKKGGSYPPRAGTESVEWDSDIPEYGEIRGESVQNRYFYGGDLDGITQMLPYIASLGTQLIYLSPVFEARSNHRYDTGDYGHVDAMLGGDGALERLCRSAAEHEIGIMLDGVFNHTGDDSVYFNKYGSYPSLGAYQSEDSPYAPWYTFSRFPDVYECWWGIDTLPRVVSENASWRRFILGRDGILRKYLKMGVMGWRLDVCDELSDVFLDELRSCAKKAGDIAVLGEVWEDASHKTAYGKRRRYLRGSQLDSVMNYPFREAVLDYVRYGDFQKFRSITEGIFRRYPECSVHCAMNVLGTHDTARVITSLAGVPEEGKCGSELAHARLSADERSEGEAATVFAFALMCALPGAVSIFYGDEVGLEGYSDPFCRRPFPWGSENSEMTERFGELGRLKRDMAELRYGEYELRTATEQMLEIHRYVGERRTVAYFNRGDTLQIDIPEGYRAVFGDAGEGTAILPRYGALFLSV